MRSSSSCATGKSYIETESTLFLHFSNVYLGYRTCYIFFAYRSIPYYYFVHHCILYIERDGKCCKIRNGNFFSIISRKTNE